MKSLPFFFFISFLFLLGCTQQPKPKTKVVTASTAIAENMPDGNLAEASFTISGMMCKVGCAKTIENNLNKMEGVQTASVDFETSIATVRYYSTLLNTEDLAQTVIGTGDAYAVSNMSSDSKKKSSCCAQGVCQKETCAKKNG